MNPTLTAPAHVSIATGSTPQQHGIVSNTFHLRGTPPRQSMRGFDMAIDGETLWEAARRQGKKVGVLTFPGADNRSERRRGDWGLVYADSVTDGRLLTINQFATADHPARPPSFSPALQSKVSWGFAEEGVTVSRQLDLFVVDTTDDRRVNYNAISLHDGERLIIPDPQRWFAITAQLTTSDGKMLYGSWSKLLRLDDKGKEVVLYWGPISRNDGYPASYREMIDSLVGFWPGPSDEALAADWQKNREGIDPDTFHEQLQRLCRFLTTATLISMRSMPWDLILEYQPVIDEAEHQFLVVNDRQQWSTPENRAQGERVRHSTYSLVNESIEAIAGALPHDGVLLVTGDHGLAPTDTLVRVNRLLVDWGLTRLEERRIANDSAWAAYTSGTLAHIYSFQNGSKEEMERIAERLRNVRTSDGDPVFEEVRLKTDQDHGHSGDIIATGYPRFSMRSDVQGEAISKAHFFGQHGGLNHHREYHTLLAAIGPTDVAIPEAISQTDIAGIVSRLLGIRNPASPAGNASALRESLHR